MEITVFAKNRKTNDGRPFKVYVSRLVNKEGETHSISVKFPENNKPDHFPINIAFEKSDGNLSIHNVYNDEHELKYVRRTLWLKNWTETTPYVDTSLDEYDFL